MQRGQSVAKEASSWSGMGPPHHQTRGVGRGPEQRHHVATLLPVPPGIKVMRGVGVGSLHPRWHRGPALEDSFLPHLA